MATISSLGIGSNLDLGGLLDSIKAGEQAPLVALQKRQTAFTAKLSAYGQVSSALSALQTASQALAKPELFTAVKASSNDNEVVSATAAASASSGVYAINVTQLSQAQSVAAAGVASTTGALATGTGTTTLMIDFGKIAGGALDTDGKYTGASFAPAGLPLATAANAITIDPAKSSLADIRDAINGNAAMGVTASIVNDGSSSPNRLVLTSKETGEASSMRITVTGDAALASLLSNNPAGLPAEQLQQTVAAQNSQLTVNGIAVTSANNTVVDAAPGVTMTLAKLGTSTLTVNKDNASVEGAINNFVKAFNGLQSVASKLSAFDASSSVGGALLGDSVLRNIQVGIRSALTSAQADNGSGLTMLSNIGLSFQKDGTLSADATKLKATLSDNLSGVAKLFSGNAGVGGYGTQMAALITGYTNTDGTLSAATKGLSTSLDTLKDRYAQSQERIEATVARYKAQFTALDLMISRMTATSSYLTQQFEIINAPTK